MTYSSSLSYHLKLKAGGGYAEKSYDSHSLTLGDLQAFLSAGVQDAHYHKQETSSAVQLSSGFSSLSNDLSTKYLHLLSSRVSYDWMQNFQNDLCACSSFLSSTIHYGSSWRLSATSLDGDAHAILSNELINLVHSTVGDISASLMIMPKGDDPLQSRQFMVFVDNGSNTQPLGLAFSSASKEDLHFCGSGSALDTIPASTSCLIAFKEVDDDTFFVRRWEVSEIGTKRVTLVDFVSCCVDTTWSKIPGTSELSVLGNKPNTKITVGDAPLIAGYTFQRYRNYNGTEEYDAGDVITLTSDFKLYAQYSRDSYVLVRFFDPDDTLISTYMLKNGEIVSPLDPETDKPFKKIQFPELTSSTATVKWVPSSIPILSNLTADYSFYALWIPNEQSEDEINEGQISDDIDVIIQDDDGNEIDYPDTLLSTIFLISVTPAVDDLVEDSDLMVLATESDDDYPDGFPATVIATSYQKISYT